MLEILVIPGVGVIGILGGLLIVVAIYGAYSISATYGHIALLASVVLSVASIYFSLKSKTWKKASLSVSTDGRVNVIDENEVKEGDTGITVSRLAVVGNARINDKIFEVESTKGFIDTHTKVEVTKVTGNKIYVKPVLVNG